MFVPTSNGWSSAEEAMQIDFILGVNCNFIHACLCNKALMNHPEKKNYAKEFE